MLTLKQMLQKYVEFQDEVVRRRTQFDLKKAKERAHILEGLKKATDIVDELIATIRACKGGMAEAKAAIMEQFGFDDPQADAIVKLQLGRLAGLEILKIEEELSGLQAKIEDWEDILANDARVLEIVKNELLDMKKRFGDERAPRSSPSPAKWTSKTSSPRSSASTPSPRLAISSASSRPPIRPRSAAAAASPA